MSGSTIPTVDLSRFFNGGDEQAKNEAKETIGKACSEYGFFQISNHGIPLDLMARALELAKTFLEYPYEEKIKAKPREGAPLPAGYTKQPDHSADKNEYLLMFPPGSPFNVFPSDPHQLGYANN